MPSLAQTLPPNDLGFLRIVASLWGLDLVSSDPAEAAIELADSLCDAELLEEVVSTMPKDGRSALDALLTENGRISWVAFTRRFGDLREMGPGKRDREQPHLRPSSAAEILWYRALMSKAFFNTDKGPLEFAFIPDDLFMALDFAGMIPEAHLDEAPAKSVTDAVIPVVNPAEKPRPKYAAPAPSGETGDLLGRPASPAEKVATLLASDDILDDACTYLAALRLGMEPSGDYFVSRDSTRQKALREILAAAHLVTPSGLNPEAVKIFLESPRSKALESLQDAWQASDSFNELRQLPGIVVDENCQNQPLVTREFILNLLEPIPDEQWWSLPALVRDIKNRYPDYQRPAGDYDSWFIKRAIDGVFLRGFANWDEIDGALVRFMICGPLHWMGLLDLAAPEEGAPVVAFRTHPHSAPVEENAKLTVTSQGKVIIPRLTPRAVRYQVARFCEWEDLKDQDYPYSVTAGSLKRAREQGLKAEQLLGILRKHAASPLPPVFVKALQRWEQNGTEARVENLVVLKVSKPELLSELRSSKAARFLGEIIGPTTIVIQAGAQARVMSALAELGILAEGQFLESK